MAESVAELELLARRMEARVAQGFRVTPRTGRLVIEALRRYAEAVALDWLDPFRVEELAASGERMALLALATSHALAIAAFEAAARQAPARWIVLRRRNQLYRENRPAGATPAPAAPLQAGANVVEFGACADDSRKPTPGPRSTRR